MKKSLLLAYHYPPIAGPGVFRTLKFSKYLPHFNYQPIILTVKNPLYKIRDPSLLNQIPSKAKVHRIFSFEHSIFRAPRKFGINLKWFYLPDEHIGWIPFAVNYGSKLVKTENIDVIFATAPLYTTLIIGSLIKKKTNKPLIIDYRDPWITNSYIEYPTKLHRRIEAKMEKYVLNQADYVTVVNDLIKDDLIKRYPFVKKKIETLPNGFDLEDFENIKSNKKSNKFQIVYTGSIYGPRTAKNFLYAIKNLVTTNKEFKENIEVLFVGNQGKDTQRYIKNLKLEKYVKILGYLPYKKCLEIAQKSVILLLLVPSKENLPAKIFEYLAFQKPILAIAPNDSLASQLIRSLNAGIIVPLKNSNSIKKAILKFYAKWKNRELNKYLSYTDEIQKYSRKSLSNRLVEIFDKIQK